MSVVRKACGDASSENLLIQGDNLLVLKSILPYYRGAVKCVYIDPPFNTGGNFPEYDDNLDHAQWLGMMFPRLVLLRELLSEDGSIWVSIGGREAAHLKVMMDEIFGRGNFINLVAHTTAEPSGFRSAARGVFPTANYVCVHAKNRGAFRVRRQYVERDYDKRYSRFLENRGDHWSKWRWTTLNAKIAADLGYESSRKAKRELGADRFAEEIARFAVANADSVFRTATISGGAGDRRWKTIERSRRNREKVFVHPGEDAGDFYILGGDQMVFYSRAMVEIGGCRTPGKILTDVWTDISWAGIAREGGVILKNGKKPERLAERVLLLTTTPGDLVMDAFLGSGTTAAVAHKMRRRWIGIEKGRQAETLCAKRLRAVVAGEDSGGVTASAKWKGGGGFHFLRLGEPIFVGDGRINPSATFPALAAHVWFAETRTPLSPRVGEGPFLGVHQGTGYALLYNGILKDKRANGGNVLTHSVLRDCRVAARMRGLPDAGRLVIYGSGCLLRRKALWAANAVFQQIPRKLNTR